MATEIIKITAQIVISHASIDLPPLWLLLGHLQPFLSPDSFHSLVVHYPAVTS